MSIFLTEAAWNDGKIVLNMMRTGVSSVSNWTKEMESYIDGSNCQADKMFDFWFNLPIKKDVELLKYLLKKAGVSSSEANNAMSVFQKTKGQIPNSVIAPIAQFLNGLISSLNVKKWVDPEDSKDSKDSEWAEREKKQVKNNLLDRLFGVLSAFEKYSKNYVSPDDINKPKKFNGPTKMITPSNINDIQTHLIENAPLVGVVDLGITPTSIKTGFPLKKVLNLLCVNFNEKSLEAIFVVIFDSRTTAYRNSCKEIVEYSNQNKGLVPVGVAYTALRNIRDFFKKPGAHNFINSLSWKYKGMDSWKYDAISLYVDSILHKSIDIIKINNNVDSFNPIEIIELMKKDLKKFKIKGNSNTGTTNTGTTNMGTTNTGTTNTGTTNIVVFFNLAKITCIRYDNNEKVSKSMIAYVKKVGKISDAEIKLSSDGKSCIVPNIACKLIYDDLKMMLKNSPFTTFGIPFDDVFEKYPIKEAVLSIPQRQKIIEGSIIDGNKVAIIALVDEAGYGRANNNAAKSFFRKIKLNPDDSLFLSKNDAVTFCKWMNQEIKKWLPYRLKFPYVMEQAAFFEQAYLYYGGLKEDLDSPSFNVSNSFDERIQGVVSELTEKVLEKCLEKIK